MTWRSTSTTAVGRKLHGRVSAALLALAPARRPLVLAGVGLLLILVVAQSALAGLARIRHEDRIVTIVATMASAHQNADMEHDALHADVSRLLTGAADTSVGQARADVTADAVRYRVSLQRLEASAAPGAVARQLADVIAQQRQYIATAEQVAGAPLSRATAAQSLQNFDRSFAALVSPMAALTDRLAGLQAEASASSSRAQDAAARRVLAAAGIAVLTLLALSWGLSRMGMRLVRAGAQGEFASTLQQGLLPVALPTHPGVECAARYLPTAAGAEVGGDWHDAFLLPDGNLALVIGDVAGHDMQAASVMGKMRSALRAYALEGHRPSDVLAQLNHFTIRLHPTVMTTCIYAVYSAETRTLTWANAGHYPPLLVTTGGAEYLRVGSARPPIGAQAGTSYRELVEVMPPRSRLLLFTDGLIERRGHDIDDGLQALAEAGTRARPGADGLCLDVLAACLPQGTADDDVALLAIATDPQPTSPESAVKPRLAGQSMAPAE